MTVAVRMKCLVSITLEVSMNDAKNVFEADAAIQCNHSYKKNSLVPELYSLDQLHRTNRAYSILLFNKLYETLLNLRKFYETLLNLTKLCNTLLNLTKLLTKLYLYTEKEKSFYQVVHELCLLKFLTPNNNLIFKS